MGSFIVASKKTKRVPLKHKPSPVPPQMAPLGTAWTASPPSQPTMSESSDEPARPLNNNSGAFNNTAQSIPSYTLAGWRGSQSVDLQKQ